MCYVNILKTNSPDSQRTIKLTISLPSTLFTLVHTNQSNGEILTAAMTVKDLIEKVTNGCCSGLDHEEDEKPMKIYGSPNKNKVAEEPKKEEPQLEEEPAVKETVEEPAEEPVEEPVEEPCASPTEVEFSGIDTKYLDYKWDDLPKDAQEAAVALGFDQDAWDNAGWPVTQDKWWKDLTEEETAGALAMGWDETSWDNKYEKLNWADIPPQVKLAAETFGFDQVGSMNRASS
jgi:hypothetical protein